MSNTPEQSESDSEEYKVGRGRPPKHTQFQPGRSGNPSGKRKPVPPYEHLMQRILRERMPCHENGRPASLTRAKNWVKRLVYLGAVVGDPVAEDILLDFEKPWDSVATGTLEFRLADSDDDIPPPPKTQRRA